MNLKEAFRFQNKLNDILHACRDYLYEPEHITQVKRTHLRHRVMPDHPDEVEIISAKDWAIVTPNEMVQFMMDMLEVKKQLSLAVRHAKMNQDFDLDSAIELNGRRQEASQVLRWMANLRPKEEVFKNGGMGFRFNQEGNQVTYCCDLEQVTTIDYDRHKVRQLAAQLSSEADQISNDIDLCLITTKVAFEPPFDVNATFEEILENYYR